MPTSESRVVIRRTIAATPEEVFAAWTDAATMGLWMRPGSTSASRVELDVRVGGAFTIDMMHGERVHVHRGEYLEIDPPHLLVFSWISDGTQQERSIVRVELHARGEETELVLTHERLPSEDAEKSHRRGWTDIVEALALRLERGHSAD
ncbi:MAG: SRPBCC domain-containing protein [Gemmatimonadota bacterium]|nr:SRPBCC domain-containing protein [Gemmatimonadota bacterium]